MSKARVELAPGDRVTVTLELDLLRTVGDRPSYFELSELADPSNDANVQQLLADLPGAVRVLIGPHLIQLKLISVRFPDEPEGTFLDPLSWPRTELVLEGRRPLTDLDFMPEPITVQFSDTFLFEEPIATTVIETKTGKNQTRWLVTGQRSPVFHPTYWPGQQPPTRKEYVPPFATYIIAGIRHILPGGLDHLLFVAGLLLASRSIRRLVVAVSLFTLAHSITLVAGTLGWVQPSAWVIEPLILASIVWVGVVNLRGSYAGRTSWLVVFVFGLLHGFGFASAVRDLELPVDQTITAMLAFNVGVEIGQLGFLAILLGAYSIEAKTRRFPPENGLLHVVTPVQRTGGGLIILGTVWLLLSLIGVV